MTNAVAVKVELSDDFLSDILITAFDGSCGGSWYWAEPIVGIPTFGIDKAENVMNDCWRWLAVNDRESDGIKLLVVDHVRLTNGIQSIIDGSVALNAEIHSSVLSAVLESDAGYIDATAADCIVQAGMFGEVIYG